MGSSLARVTHETSQVLFAGGQVVLLGDRPFLAHLTTDSAQTEWNSKTQIKKKIFLGAFSYLSVKY